MPNRLSTDIDQAVTLLRAGGVVAVPTETVYGLGVDAMNPVAVERVFQIKGRPSDHPLIVHISDATHLSDWAREIPEAAYQLAAAFWPGPLTLILKRHPSVPDAVTGGQDTVGIRIPRHPIMQALLKRFGGGIAAPSANRFGRISPTSASHVWDELDDDVDLILDGGPCHLGLESTIVSLVGDEPRVLRPGAVTLAALRAVLGFDIRFVRGDAVRVSGTLESHYAPRTPLFLLAPDQLAKEAERRGTAGERVGIMTYTQRDWPSEAAQAMMPDSPEAYGQTLYATLRRLDQEHFAAILVEQPPEEDSWLAINDRLRRAAAGR